MAYNSPEDSAPATAFFRDPQNRRWLASAAVLSIGLIIGGYLLGDGLVRAREADRAVTVRGLAERDVTADLATWTVAYSATAPDLMTAQSQIDGNSNAIRAFFREVGFLADALQPSGVNVSQFTDNNGVTKFTVRQRMTMRTTDVPRAQDAVKRQFDLVRSGVVLEEGSGIAYTFTKLNSIKPEMVALATRDARASADRAISRSTPAMAIPAAVGVFPIRRTKRSGSLRQSTSRCADPTPGRALLPPPPRDHTFRRVGRPREGSRSIR